MIIVSNISKQFGKLKALDNISVTCCKGECIALIGPNGSGKTTLIKCILGMVVPDSGFITFNENNIRKDFHSHIASRTARQIHYRQARLIAECSLRVLRL